MIISIHFYTFDISIIFITIDGEMFPFLPMFCHKSDVKDELGYASHATVQGVANVIQKGNWTNLCINNTV